MKMIIPVILIGLFAETSCQAQEEAPKKNEPKTGSISGKVSPEGVAITIIAKLAGTSADKKENVKGQVTLPAAGAFTLRDLPPGKYDLLFKLDGDSATKYMASRWSEIVVEAGKTTSGINYRLTPSDAKHMVDEILVGFQKDITEAEARKTIESLGCTPKDRPTRLGGIMFTLDIPDDKSVEDLIAAFKQKKEVRYAEPNGIAGIKKPGGKSTSDKDQKFVKAGVHDPDDCCDGKAHIQPATQCIRCEKEWVSDGHNICHKCSDELGICYHCHRKK